MSCNQVSDHSNPLYKILSKRSSITSKQDGLSDLQVLGFHVTIIYNNNVTIKNEYVYLICFIDNLVYNKNVTNEKH